MARQHKGSPLVLCYIPFYIYLLAYPFVILGDLECKTQMSSRHAMLSCLVAEGLCLIAAFEEQHLVLCRRYLTCKVTRRIFAGYLVFFDKLV